MIFAALDAYEILSQKRNITRIELEPIIDAMRSGWVAADTSAGHLLAELASRHVAAQEALRELTTSRKSKERSAAIYCLSNEIPKLLLCELLTLGIIDRSKAVCRRAAMKCDLLRLKEMLPELEKRIVVERDNDLKYELEFHAAMIRNGYMVKRNADGSLTLHVREKNGWSSQEISQEDIDGGSIPVLVAERQSKKY